MGLDPNESKLLYEMLDDYSDILGNNGCNDWKWPSSWSLGYRKDFLDRFNVWVRTVNGNEEPWWKHDGEYGPPDFLILGFLRSLLKV